MKISRYLISALLILCLSFAFAGCVQNPPEEGTNSNGTESNGQQEDVVSLDGKLVILTNMEKHTRDEHIADNGVSKLTASLARNESEGMQFTTMFDSAVTNVKVSVSDLKNSAGEKISDVVVYREKYIEILDSNGEDRGAGWYPDALIRLYDGSDGHMATDVCNIAEGQNQAFWITVTTSLNQTAGKYTGTMTFTYDQGEKLDVPIEVTVWDITLPETSTLQTDFGIWGTNAYEAAGYSWKTTNNMYWEFLLKYRLSGRSLSTNESPTNADAWAAEVKAFIDTHPRVTAFQVPLYGYNLTVDLKKEDISENPTNKAIYEALTKYDLLDKAYYYVVDEPEGSGTFIQIVRTFCEGANAFPGIRNLITTSYPEYDGYLSLWCPIIQHVTEANVAKWHGMDSDVWWYTCCSPTYPYPTYHINDYLVSSRVLHWMARDYNITGELYWASNLTTKYAYIESERTYKYIDRDVWNDPYAFGNTAGDGFICYAGLEGDGVLDRYEIIPTVRIESIRDGVEDYEYLVMLEQKYAKAIEKYNISDFDLDELMDMYYTALYSASYEYDQDFTKLAKIRESVAHDLMSSDDVLVANLTQKQLPGESEIRVYAPADATVTIDGKTAVYKNGYFSLNIKTVSEGRFIEISVNGEKYIRFIRTLTENECITQLHEKLIIAANELGINVDTYAELYEKSFISSELDTDALKSAAKDTSFKSVLNGKTTLAYLYADCAAFGYSKMGIQLSVTVPTGTKLEVPSALSVTYTTLKDVDIYQILMPPSDNGYGLCELNITSGSIKETQSLYYEGSNSAVLWLEAEGIDNNIVLNGAGASANITIEAEDISSYENIGFTVVNEGEKYAMGIVLTVITEDGNAIEIGKSGIITVGSEYRASFTLPVLESKIIGIRIFSKSKNPANETFKFMNFFVSGTRASS